MKYPYSLFSLENKVVVLTGISGQLGTSLKEAFCSGGALVAGLDIADNTDTNGIDYYKVDIRDEEEVLKVFRNVAGKYGKIDILVNNAGIAVFEPFEERDEKSFDDVMSVNLKGTFICIKSYVRVFDELGQKEGNIINISSIFGVISPDFRNYTDCNRKSSEVYGATKAGIIQMTKYFAVHLAGRNIRVNAVSPGGILNEDNPQGEDFQRNYAFRCPMKRMARAVEMVGAVVYLASGAASYTTGQNIVVDGGMSCW